MNIPKLSFKLMTFEENTMLMADFIHEELGLEEKANTNYIKNKYKSLGNVMFDNLDMQRIDDILKANIYDEWNQDMINYNDKLNFIEKAWSKINDEVMSDLSERLNMPWPKDYLNIECRLGIMYFCPRYLNEHMFDINIEINTDAMINLIIHEVCHFIYFEKWKQLFKDYDQETFEAPHMVWYLSEAMIDPLLNTDVFKKYTKYEIRSYDEFYNIFIINKNVIECLREITLSKNIDDAIREGYQLFLDNNISCEW